MIDDESVDLLAAAEAETSERKEPGAACPGSRDGSESRGGEAVQAFDCRPASPGLPRPELPLGDAGWDEGLLTLARYVDLDSPEWVARQTAATGELLALPGRRERRAAARREWRSHAKVELLAGVAGRQLELPDRAAELARLATAAAAAVSPSALTAMDDLRPRSLLVLARACRHQGRYREAERALTGAARRLHDPHRASERGVYLTEVGKLRWEQGRLDVTISMLELAAGGWKAEADSETKAEP